MSDTKIQDIQGDIKSLKKQVAKISNMLTEDFELSDDAKKELKLARSEKEVVSHQEVMKEFA